MTRPRVLFVGRTRYELPLPDWLAKKFAALQRELDFHVLASAATKNIPGDGRFSLVRPSPLLDGPLFYARLPARIAGAIRTFRPEAIVAEDPHVAAAALIARRVAGSPQPVVIAEVHGNWRLATRLYGSPARTLLGPVSDAVGAQALRRADAVRALSGYTAALVEDVRGSPPTAVFPTFSDLEAFRETPPLPLPEQPTALFVGALERYKNVDNIAVAWRRVARALPEARLVVVGDGRRRPAIEALASELQGRVDYVPKVTPREVACRLDESWVLLMPSRSEGFGRVFVESFARGRGVIGGTGGVRDLVEDQRQGLLVDPENVDAIADALLRILADRELAERLGGEAALAYERWHTTADDFARRVRALVEAALD